SRLLRVFTLAGIVASGYYLGNVLVHIDLYMSQHSYANRAYFGSGSFLSMLALGLLIDPALRAEMFRGLSLRGRNTLFASGALHLAAILVSQSRTMLLLLGSLVAIRVLLSPLGRRGAVFGGSVMAFIGYV